MKVTLDKYEQEIEEALADGEFVSMFDQDTKTPLKEAVKNYKELQDTKSITLRVKKVDLIKVKAQAKRNGIAYQTLISLLIRRYVEGEDKLVLD